MAGLNIARFLSRRASHTSFVAKQRVLARATRPVLESLKSRRMMSASGAATTAAGSMYTLNLKPDLTATVTNWSVN